MPRITTTTLFAALLVAPLAVARAQPAAPGVVAEHVWARATPPSARTAAAYLSITSQVADRLVAATTPVAGMAEIHESIADGGVMRMRPVQGGLALTPGKAAVLAPGGQHVMLMDLHQPLRAGDSFPLTLRFANAPPITVTVAVQPIGATGDAMPGTMHR